MEALTQGVYNNATEQVNKVQLESLMTLLNLKIELVGHCETQGCAKLMAVNFVDSSFSVILDFHRKGRKEC